MKTLLKIFLLAGISISNNADAQKPITWQRTYGDGNIDYGYSIVQTPDEGYIAVGRKRINTTSYMFAMRLNKYGDTIWTRTFHGYQANQIEKTSEGNYIICGSNLIKINIQGDTLWTSLQGYGAKLKETPDKGFIICLSAYNGPYLFYPKLKKVDSLGNIQWERTFTENIYDGRFSDITVDSEGNYLLTGNFSDTSYIWDYMFVMKTNQFGNIIWFKKYKPYMYTNCILITQGNKIIVGGDYNKSFLISLTSTGKLTWLKYYDDSSEYGTCKSAILTNDGGIAFTGTYSNGNFDLICNLLQ